MCYFFELSDVMVPYLLIRVSFVADDKESECQLSGGARGTTAHVDRESHTETDDAGDVEYGEEFTHTSTRTNGGK